MHMSILLIILGENGMLKSFRIPIYVTIINYRLKRNIPYILNTLMSTITNLCFQSYHLLDVLGKGGVCALQTECKGLWAVGVP